MLWQEISVCFTLSLSLSFYYYSLSLFLLFADFLLSFSLSLFFFIFLSFHTLFLSKRVSFLLFFFFWPSFGSTHKLFTDIKTLLPSLVSARVSDTYFSFLFLDLRWLNRRFLFICLYWFCLCVASCFSFFPFCTIQIAFLSFVSGATARCELCYKLVSHIKPQKTNRKRQKGQSLFHPHPLYFIIVGRRHAFIPTRRHGDALFESTQ